jgi:vitamin B12 transporter
MRSNILRRTGILLILPLVSLAQVPDSLPRIVITATRVDTRTGSDIPAASVIDRALIDRTGVRDVAELLRFVPGVSVVRSGGPGAQSSLFLRGGENDYVRVLVDGVPVNDPGGAVDLAWLSVDDVERIEVVRGPASVLYGTDAVSGVVQVFTRRSSRPAFDAEVAAGRYGRRLLRGNLTSGTDQLSLSLGGARESSNGILPFNSDYERDVFSAALVARPATTTRLDVAVRGVNDEYHFPTDGGGVVGDVNAYRDTRRLIASASVSQVLTSRVRSELLLSAMDVRGRDDDAPDAASDTVGFYYYDAFTSVRRRSADARVHFMPASSAVLTVGGELVREAQRGNDSSNFSFERSRFVADRRNGAVYGQWLSEHGAVALTAGARYDDNNTFGSFRTARAGLSLRTWRGGSFRMSAGTAFKSPTFFESFNTAFSTGNTDLDPERSRSWEAGVRHVGYDRRLTVGATWFDQRFRDMIQYAFVSPEQPNYFNVAAASARGLELEATLAPTSTVRLGATTTLLKTRVDDAGLQEGESATFVKGNRLLRRPATLATGTMALDLPGQTTADALVTWTGRRDDRDFSVFPAEPVVLPAWSRVDIGITRPIQQSWSSARFELHLRLENVFGAGYEEIANYPAPGRSLTIALRSASLRR